MKPKLEDSGEKLSKEDIKEFEEEIGQELPKDYIKFLLENNGGVIEDEYYRHFYYNGDESIYIHKFLTLDEIFYEPDADENDLKKNWLAIAEDGDSSYLFLSLDKNDYGNIYFWDMEHDDFDDDDIDDDEINENPLLITTSFTNLINNFERDRSTPEFLYLIGIRDFKKLNDLLIKKEINILSTNSNNQGILELIIFCAPDQNDVKFKEVCNLVKYLIENGADTKFVISQFPTLSITEFLLKNGFNINQQDKDGKTTLMHWAAYRHHVGVKYLLDNGVDINIKDNNGKRAIDYAFYGKEKIKAVPISDYDKVIELLKRAEEN